MDATCSTTIEEKRRAGTSGRCLSREIKEPYPFLMTPFVEVRARFSPDGRWVAYQSNESGRADIYVQEFPGPGGKWQISTAGGTEPQWSPDGEELYYISPEMNMMRVSVETGESFDAGIPEDDVPASVCARSRTTTATWWLPTASASFS